MGALSLEACGFAERGQGPRLGLDKRDHAHGAFARLHRAAD